jgi:UDP-N-acetylmuramoylalanine--D-glutamate ligase
LSFLAGTAVADGSEFRLWQGESYSVSNRALRGAHNLENAMAAALMARLCGVDRESIQRALDRFPGLAHRLEWVRTLDGVEWINDSKATNVDSSLVALAALPGPIWLIAGGRGKGAPYRPMVDASEGKLKGVLTIGLSVPESGASRSASSYVGSQWRYGPALAGVRLLRPVQKLRRTR